MKRLRSRLLRSDAEYLSGVVAALVRSAGSVERLAAGLPASDRALIVASLASACDELRLRADAAEATAAVATGEASSNPAVVAASAQVLRRAGWTVLPPD